MGIHAWLRSIEEYRRGGEGEVELREKRDREGGGWGEGKGREGERGI